MATFGFMIGLIGFRFSRGSNYGETGPGALRVGVSKPVHAFHARRSGPRSVAAKACPGRP